MSIHSTAIIADSARLADDVHVGPYSIIGDGVEIDSGCRIDSHAVVNGPTRIGKNNHIYQYCSVGDDPQDKKYAGEPTRLEIGDGNTIRVVGRCVTAAPQFETPARVSLAALPTPLTQLERTSEDLGVELNEHIQFVIDAMSEQAETLGLLRVTDEPG